MGVFFILKVHKHKNKPQFAIVMQSVEIKEDIPLTESEMLDCLYEIETHHLISLFPCCKEGRDSKHIVQSWVPRYTLRTIVNRHQEHDLELDMERGLLKRSRQQLFALIALFVSLLEACSNKLPAVFNTCCLGQDCAPNYCMIPDFAPNNVTTTLFYARFESSTTGSYIGGPHTVPGVCNVPNFVIASYTHTATMSGMVWTISIGILLAFGYTMSLSRTSTPLRIVARQLREGRGFAFSAAPLFRRYYRSNFWLTCILVIGFAAATILPFVEVFAIRNNVFFLAPNCAKTDGLFMTVWYTMDGTKSSTNMITTCLTLLVTSLFFVQTTYEMLQSLANPFQSVNPETLRAHPWQGLVTEMQATLDKTTQVQQDDSWKSYLYRAKPFACNQTASKIMIVLIRVEVSLLYALYVAALWVPIIIVEWITTQRSDVLDVNLDWTSGV